MNCSYIVQSAVLIFTEAALQHETDQCVSPIVTGHVSY